MLTSMEYRQKALELGRIAALDVKTEARKRGISVEELLDEIGVSLFTYTEWRTKRVAPRLTTYCRVMSAVGRPVGGIKDEEEAAYRISTAIYEEAMYRFGGESEGRKGSCMKAARGLGVNENTVRYMMQGRTMLLETVLKCADALDTTIYELARMER